MGHRRSDGGAGRRPTVDPPIVQSIASRSAFRAGRAERGLVRRRARSCHALCGENGAGKSTLGKICRPFTSRTRAGSFSTARPCVRQPARRAGRGIAIVHQEPTFCRNLSVAETCAWPPAPPRSDRRSRGPPQARASHPRFGGLSLDVGGRSSTSRRASASSCRSRPPRARARASSSSTSPPAASGARGGPALRAHGAVPRAGSDVPRRPHRLRNCSSSRRRTCCGDGTHVATRRGPPRRARAGADISGVNSRPSPPRATRARARRAGASCSRGCWWARRRG